MRRSPVRLLQGLAVVLLAGCAYPISVEHKDYPLDWPKPAPAASGCPDLTGRYRNHGDVQKAPLAQWAFPPTAKPMEQVDIVELDGPREGALTFRFFASAGKDGTEPQELGSRRWQQGEEFRCEDGWLVQSKTRFIPLAAYVTTDTFRFTLAADRSLVVEKREDGGGVLVVLPAYISAWNWFRYPRME